MIYDNAVTPDTTALTQWQAGKTVSHDAIEAFGGIDKCFAAEPIPDGVWQRMLLPDVYDADNDAQRQLRIGMEAQVWPANEKRDEVGYVRGCISQVVRYPARISKVR